MSHTYKDIGLSLQSKIQDDKILKQMKEDDTSMPFIQMRIRELIEEGLLEQHDYIIQQLNLEINDLKQDNQSLRSNLSQVMEKFKEVDEEKYREEAKVELLQRQNQEMQNSLNEIQLAHESSLKQAELSYSQLNQNQRQEQSSMQSKILSLTNNLDHVQSQLELREQHLKERERQLEELVIANDDKQQHINQLQKDLNDLNQKLSENHGVSSQFARTMKESELQLSQCRGQLTQVQDEYKRMQSTITLLEKEKRILNEKLLESQQVSKLQYKQLQEQEASSAQQKIQQIKHTYKSKVKQFKKKIQDQKAKLEIIDQELMSSRRGEEQHKAMLERSLLTVQMDLKKVRDEWEKKCNDLELDYQRKMAEQNSKHQMQVAQIQNQYQQLMEKKINQIIEEHKQSRLHETDLNLSIKSKLSKMEIDYIHKAKHQEILDKELAQCRQKYQNEIQRLIDENQLDTTNRVRNIQIEKQREIDQNQMQLNNLDSLCSELQRNNENLQKDLQSAKEQYQDLAKKYNSLQQEIHHNDQQRKQLSSHIEEGQINLIKLKQMYEDESARRSKLEQINQKNATEIEKLNQKYELSLRNLDESQKQSEQKLQSLSLNKDQTIQQEVNKNSQLQIEINSLKQTLARYENEKLQHQFKLEQIQENVRLEAQNSEMIIKQAKDEIQIILAEKEQMGDSLKSEIQALNEQIYSISQQNSELQIELNKTIQQNSELQDHMQRIQMKLISSEKNLDELYKDKRNIEKSSGMKLHYLLQNKDKTCRVLASRVSQLKGQILQLRNNQQYELQVLQKECCKHIQEMQEFIQKNLIKILRTFNKQHQQKQEQILTSWRDKIKGLESEQITQIQELQEKLNTKEQLCEQLQKQIEKFKKEQVNLIDQIQQQKRTIMSQEQQITLQTSKIQQLEKELLENTKAFDKLQQDVKSETSKIKQNSDSIIKLTIKETERKHQQELDSIKNQLKSVTQTYLKSNQHWQQELEKLEKIQEGELLQQQEKFQSIINEKQQIFANCLYALQNEMISFQANHIQKMSNLEQITQEVIDKIQYDTQNTQEFKQKKYVEMEELTTHLKEMTKELSSKTEYVEELLRDKETLKQTCREFNQSLELKENQWLTKEKEILGRQSILEAENKQLRILLQSK